MSHVNLFQPERRVQRRLVDVEAGQQVLPTPSRIDLEKNKILRLGVMVKRLKETFLIFVEPLRF